MRVNKKMKRAALRSALTDSAASGKLALVQELAFDGPRTKDAAGILAALELEGKVLVVLPAPDEVVEKSFRNLPAVKVGYPGNLSTFDLLYADRVLFTADALDALTGEQTERFEPAVSEAKDATQEADQEQPDGTEPEVEDADDGGDDA